MYKHPFIHLLPALVLCVLAGSSTLAQTRTEQIDELLRKYHEFRLLNGAVLVAEGGEVIYEKGLGQAVMEWDIQNTPDTKFRIGSVTKQFTAAVILRLLEEGRIRLDAPINEYLPEYPPTQGGRVTIHQLLTHTSGIPSYTSMPSFWRDLIRDPYEPDSFLSVFSGLDLEFEPGSKWDYSNSGYFLLGAIIEHVAGKPYDEALRELVLDPLGLHDTGYDHFAEILQRRAEGYVKMGDGFERAPYLDTSLPYSAGMLYSTVRDLFKWDRSLYGKGPFRERATLDLMFAPHVPVDTDTSAYYAYGWRLSTMPVREHTVKVARHGGGINGFETAFWRMPVDGHTVIILDNTASSSVEEIARQIAHILYGEPVDAPKQPISDVLRPVIDAEGVDVAIERYRTLKHTEPDTYDFSESELNRLGYEYLQLGDTETAIRIFQLNVDAYPVGYNTYDSLGEAYLAAGKEKLAIANYRRSLELNPDNRKALAVLERLVGPTLFAEGVINTDGDEYGPTFAPDGSILYFTKREVRDEREKIVVSRLIDGQWSSPTVAPFSGSGFDKEPYFSPDGSKLFFASRRRVNGEDRDFDIWVVSGRKDDMWGEAQHLDVVNSPAYDNYPAVAASGNLYFSSKRDSESNDLWVARFEDDGYAEPKSIAELNTSWSDADPYIDPHERFMIFSSTRPGGYGSGDLYVTYNREGTWSEPVNLGPIVNSEDYEYTPMLSSDGRTLYFSRGWGEIYEAEWDEAVVGIAGE